MPLPSKLADLAAMFWEQISRNASYSFDLRQHQLIYEAFGLPNDPIAKRAYSWLAILTARRVLPIFQLAFPDESLPESLIETAVGVVRGSADFDSAYEMAYEAHEIAGNLFGLPEDEVPWNAWFASIAAERALMETISRKPFQGIDKFFKFGQTQEGIEKTVSANQWSDEELAQNGGDTAIAAAVACLVMHSIQEVTLINR